jgi:glycosyltransferase involved in cell wall biosynthesis
VSEVGAATRFSVVIPVGSRQADLAELYDEYRRGLNALGRPYETIFVLDGPQPGVMEDLLALRNQDDRITVLSLSRSFGEATALAAGLERATGSIIITLPAYHQIEASGIKTLVDALDHVDMAVGRRWPRAGGRFEQLRRATFHGMVGAFTSSSFRDLGCGARAMRRQVVEDVSLYGDQHRFIALLAQSQGFRVVEVDVPQSTKDHYGGRYAAREYAHRALDILTVLFLVRFTKKPLRFFGMLGVSTFLLGAALILFMVVQRLFFDQALADRPALLLASLLAVLGLQLFAIGLLGELIIFTHARSIKDYQVQEVVHFPAAGLARADAAGARGPAGSESMNSGGFRKNLANAQEP